MSGHERRVVVVTGATGETGRAACAALTAAGHQVVAVGRDAERLAAVRAAVAGDRLDTVVCDVTDPAAVTALAEDVRAGYGRVDGLAHLVGGWRGGAGLVANTDDDWDFLRTNLVDSLRHLTQAFHDALLDSPSGRAVIIGSLAALTPTAGNANYATAKAAAHAWMAALADSFGRHQSGRTDEPTAQRAAAVVLLVTAIGDRPGFTTAAAIGARIAALFAEDAATLNGVQLDLSTPRG